MGWCNIVSDGLLVWGAVSGFARLLVCVLGS